MPIYKAALKRKSTMISNAPSQTACSLLAEFISRTCFEDLPEQVVRYAQELFLDWMASTLAGGNTRPARVFEEFATLMGPRSGDALIYRSRKTSSPYFAALINAAASHVVEQDDLHTTSVSHPATVVFPAALAMAQAQQASGRQFITAVVVGYEVCVRVGEFLGASHYKVFHTTGTAGTLATAAATANLLGLNTQQCANAIGSAGTQAAGLWEFLRDAADSKQLHTAKASADGMLAAVTAQAGLTGAKNILDGPQGMAAGMLGEGNPEKLTDRLGSRWATTETSYKFHASCRHTHPSADALLKLSIKHDLKPEQIKSITAHVYQAAIDVLGPVTDPQTIHQAKFSMGFVLALIAKHRSASINDFSNAALQDTELRRLHDCVYMIHDTKIQDAFPMQWLGHVEVETVDGKRLEGKINHPKGDPGNRLSREELETKFQTLNTYGDALNAADVDRFIQNTRSLSEHDDMKKAFWLS